jgi:hypothetical protein
MFSLLHIPGQTATRRHGAGACNDHAGMQVQVAVPAFEVVPRCCGATFLLRASILRALLSIISKHVSYHGEHLKGVGRPLPSNIAGVGFMPYLRT